jgi:hypothetical protein
MIIDTKASLITATVTALSIMPPHRPSPMPDIKKELGVSFTFRHGLVWFEVVLSLMTHRMSPNFSKQTGIESLSSFVHAHYLTSYTCDRMLTSYLRFSRFERLFFGDTATWTTPFEALLVDSPSLKTTHHVVVDFAVRPSG